MFKIKNEDCVSIKCTVRLFKDTDVLECEFQPFHKGEYLLDFLCEHLNITEKDYFGLRYVDSRQQRHWLDTSKSIIKQRKDIFPLLFSFRIKFYPADPFRLSSNSRYMLYQQLKRDLQHGRLCCSIGEAAALGALIVQDELGDYNKKIHLDDYISSMHLTLRQTDILEKQIMELHKMRKMCQPTSNIVDEFLSIASNLETYGVDPHPVKDYSGFQLYIGINHSGISTFDLGKRVQHFGWNEVHKLNFEGKMFIAHLSYTDTSRELKKHTIGYKCTTGSACKYLWRCAMEQMLFFTLPHNQNLNIISGGGFFSWGTKFKYTGRTEREILTENINILREQKMSNSSTSIRKSSSVPATPSSPQGDLEQIRPTLPNSQIYSRGGYITHYNSGYNSLPRSTFSQPKNSNMTASPNNVKKSVFSKFNSENGVAFHAISENSKLRLPSLENLENAGELINWFPHDSLEYLLTDGELMKTYVPMQSNSNIYQHTEHISDSLNKLANNLVVINSENNEKQIKYPVQSFVQDVKPLRKFYFLYTFIPSLFFVVICIIFIVIFILETESEMLEPIRNMPEMLSLRYQYYQPAKNFLLNTYEQ